MKILVATDGSEHSKAAIEKCCQIIVEPENTRILIVSAVEVFAQVPAERFDVSAESINRVETVLHRQAEAAITQAEIVFRNCFSDAAIDLTTKLVTGSPDRVIVEEAQNWGADLIVVGSHGYGFWERMLLGSVSDSVIHHAPCSVLVVRKNKIQKD